MAAVDTDLETKVGMLERAAAIKAPQPEWLASAPLPPDALEKRLAELKAAAAWSEAKHGVDLGHPAAEPPPGEPKPYVWKMDEELVWAIFFAAGTVVGQALLSIENVTDWKAWALGVIAGCLRAVGAVVKNAYVMSRRSAAKVA